jgi:hypothetical protein
MWVLVLLLCLCGLFEDVMVVLRGIAQSGDARKRARPLMGLELECMRSSSKGSQNNGRGR